MLNTVAKRMQHFCSHLRTKEMLDDVEDDVWWKSNFVQHHPTSYNIVQHGGQTSATCWIQQCWMMLHQHVGSVWPGLYSVWPVGLEAWFSLRVREVPTSTPGQALNDFFWASPRLRTRGVSERFSSMGVVYRKVASSTHHCCVGIWNMGQ